MKHLYRTTEKEQLAKAIYSEAAYIESAEIERDELIIKVQHSKTPYYETIKMNRKIQAINLEIKRAKKRLEIMQTKHDAL